MPDTLTPTFVMAVPWDNNRFQGARDLAVQATATIVWDTSHNAFDTWRQVLRAVDTGPGIILEDDVALTVDWRTKAEGVIADHPSDVIQFFSMRKADTTIGSRYEPGRSFSMNQCYYLPAGAARSLFFYSATWVEEHPEHPTGYDLCMGAWMRRNKMKYWLSVPSLVQHRPWHSAIGGRSRGRQSATFR